MRTLTEHDRATLDIDPSLRRLAARSKHGVDGVLAALRAIRSTGRGMSWILLNVPGVKIAVVRRQGKQVRYDGWE
jgi:hypothetical protein